MSLSLAIGTATFTADLDKVDWELGSKANMGERSVGSIYLFDNDNEFRVNQNNDFLLKQFSLTEDASGTAVYLARGRVMNAEVFRDDSKGQVQDVAKSYKLTTECQNAELLGITLITAETRPAETDVARVQWLESGGYLDGTYRSSTDIDCLTYVPNTNTVTMDAITYPAGTPIIEILTQCADEANKVFFVTIDHELYYSTRTDTIYDCPIVVSDGVGSHDDPDNSSVFAPQWNLGPALNFIGQNIVTGLVGTWENDKTVVVEDDSLESTYDRWVETVNLDEARNRAQARRMTSTTVNVRGAGERQFAFSVRLQADQVHLIKPGQRLNLQAIAANTGSGVDRRIAELKWVYAGEGWYDAQVIMDMPRRVVPVGPGSAPRPRPSKGTYENLLLNLSGSSLKAYNEAVSTWTKEKACDGDESANSHWSGHETNGDPVTGAWWAADLGSQKAANAFRIFTADHPGGDTPQNIATEVDVYASNAGTAWSYLVDGSGHITEDDPASNGWTLIDTHTGALTAPADSGLVTIADASYRYVLFHAVDGGTDEWDVNEFEWWGYTSNIQPVGDTAGQGDSGESADAEHVHAHGTFATGDLHTEYTRESVLTTKGDIYVATGAGTVTRLAVGSNDQVLTADSAQSAGIKWATPSSSGTQDVRKNSTGTVFSRTRLNLIEGNNITLTVADDAGNDEVDITIAATTGTPGTGGRGEHADKYNPDHETPSTTPAVADEFNGSTTGTWDSAPGTADLTTYPGHYNIDGDTNERHLYWAWSPGATDITVAAKVGINELPGGEAASSLGIYLGDATGNPSNSVLLQIEQSGGLPRLSAYNENGAGSFSNLFTHNADFHDLAEGDFYLMIQRSITGPVWRFYFSRTGKPGTWHRYTTTGSKSLTIAAVGFRADSDSPFALDWIRAWSSLVDKVGA